MNRHLLRPGLYLLTPDESNTQRLCERVSAVLPYATLLQYRNKQATAALRFEQAVALKAVCETAGIALIVNDDAPLAQRCAASGVHLGEDDGAIAAARELLGDDATIGASCYNTLQHARSAAEAGADYLAFGAMFASTSKPNARRANLALLTQARRFGLPLVAIGGITPDNARLAIAAGADLIAVISGVFGADDPVAAARAYRTCFD